MTFKVVVKKIKMFIQEGGNKLKKRSIRFFYKELFERVRSIVEKLLVLLVLVFVISICCGQYCPSLCSTIKGAE